MEKQINGKRQPIIAENIIFNRIKHLSASIIRLFKQQAICTSTGRLVAKPTSARRNKSKRNNEKRTKWKNRENVNKPKLIINWRKRRGLITRIWMQQQQWQRMLDARFYPLICTKFMRVHCTCACACATHATRILCPIERLDAECYQLYYYVAAYMRGEHAYHPNQN